MSHALNVRLRAAALLIVGGYLTISEARAATYTTPRQLLAGDIYDLIPDSATGDEETTCPKTDANTGTGGDNPYFQRTNVARAHVGGCGARYWYTSNFQMLCTDVPPVNTCGGGPCLDEPDVNGPQYVDYAPPFGSGASQLTPGRYKIIGEYRNTTSRAPYPAEYMVNYFGGTTTILKSQLDGISGSCPSFDIGIFDLSTSSFVRVNDSGNSSITFNHMRFQLVSALGGAPLVNAGGDQTVIMPSSAALAGTVSDDGVPNPLTATWSQMSGPGTANFLDANSPSTTVSFTLAGSYTLRLTAFDGATSAMDDVNITVLAAGGTLIYSTQYEFNDPTNPDPSTATGVIDADAGDANGNGLLTKIGNGFGNSGGGIAGGVLHFVDSSSSGNFGWYWQNNGTNITYTVDLAVRVTSGVTGTTNRRSMGFSAGPSKSLGLRLHKTNDGAGSPCTAGSVRFAASSGGTGTEGCIDFTNAPTQFHRLRIAVDSVANTFHVFDLDTQTALTDASGSSGTQSWAAEIDGKGGYHIGSISGSNTTLTNYELDYFRVLLGVAVDSATTSIRTIGQCHTVAFDSDGDNDVDMTDFGAFQNCYTGDSSPYTINACQCFDSNSDGFIGEPDFHAFQTCAATSRAGVPANATICNGS